MTTKLCIGCGTHHSVDQFTVDRSRPDGLKPYCKVCVKGYVPKGSKRDLKGTEKECVGCGRTLCGEKFLTGQTADGLTDDCRTCRTYKTGHPTTEQAILHEARMQDIFRRAVRKILATYGFSPYGVLEEHRAEFEQACYVMMDREGILDKWKMPIWVNKVSLPD